MLTQREVRAAFPEDAFFSSLGTPVPCSGPHAMVGARVRSQRVTDRGVVRSGQVTRPWGVTPSGGVDQGSGSITDGKEQLWRSNFELRAHPPAGTDLRLKKYEVRRLFAASAVAMVSTGLAVGAGAQTISNGTFNVQVGSNGEISSLQLTNDAFPTNYVMERHQRGRAEHPRPRVGRRADVHLSPERRRLYHRAHQPVERRAHDHHGHQLGHRHLSELDRREGRQELQGRRDLCAGLRLSLLDDHGHQHQHADAGDRRLRAAAAVQPVLEAGQRHHLPDAHRLSLVHRQQQLVHHRRAAERRRLVDPDGAGSIHGRRLRVHGRVGRVESTEAAPGSRAAARRSGRPGSTSSTSTRTSSRARTAAICRTPA